MIARDNQQQAVETGHLLKSLLTSEDKVTSHLLGKAGVNTADMERVLDRIIDSYSKVTGGEQYLSSEANRALQKALDVSKSMKDQFASLEHILLGLLSVGDQVSILMKDFGANEKDLLTAVNDLRKGSKVNSPTAEDTYNALNRYAVNLNDQARKGKLDPVIGRDEEIRRVLQILSRRTKNNPVLIGEPGVGKTAKAEG